MASRCCKNVVRKFNQEGGKFFIGEVKIDERNIESNKQLITETRLQQRELFKLLNKFTLNEVEV